MVSQRSFIKTLFDSGSACTLRQGDTFRHVHNLPPFSMNWTTLKIRFEQRQQISEFKLKNSIASKNLTAQHPI